MPVSLASTQIKEQRLFVSAAWAFGKFKSNTPPSKAIQSDGRSRKETAHVPSWNRESGALAVGKMLTKYFQLWTTTSGVSEDNLM